MTIGFKAPANAANFNAAFASKQANNVLEGNQEIQGVLSLTEPGSGGDIDNTQQSINDNISNITTNASNIATNAGSIATNASDISELQALNLKKSNLTAIVAPTINDDETLDYEVGSLWYNSASNKFYVCEDATTGAAIWTIPIEKRNNLTATSDPSVNDDETATPPYEAGSLWYNQTNDTLFVNENASTGAALWGSISGGGGGGGGGAKAVTSQSSAYTALTTDDVILMDTTSGNLTLTLPVAATAGAGKEYEIKKTVAANILTVDADSTETIDGELTRTLVANGQSMRIISDGSNWQILDYEEAVCYIYDEKASGTDGGTFTSGSFQTRTLNTTSGDTSMVSLSSNQFTIPAGDYRINADAPAYLVDNHKTRLRNISDTFDVLIGSAEHTSSAAGVTTESRIKGRFSISASKAFELQHRCQATRSTDGFGYTDGVVGEFEIYAFIELVKIK